VHTWLFLGWSVARQEPSGWPEMTVGAVVSAALGAVIVTRHPGHRVGWLFIVGSTCAALGDPLISYDAIAAAGAHPLAHGMGPDVGQRAAVSQAAVSRSGPKADLVT
jgi:hypothetical protein